MCCDGQSVDHRARTFVLADLSGTELEDNGSASHPSGAPRASTQRYCRGNCRLSSQAKANFASGAADAAIIRRNGGGTQGEVLRVDRLGRRAVADWRPRSNTPIPSVVGLGLWRSRDCRERTTKGRRQLADAFIAGSCAAQHEGLLAGAGANGRHLRARAARSRARTGASAAADVGDCSSFPCYHTGSRGGRESPGRSHVRTGGLSRLAAMPASMTSNRAHVM
ncbi:LysR family transcriptional regulator [Pseudorhizobium endolithicum]|uniref:LysR family transcriptional regulator n=1 Tax=Pseudorhizobium endolithicum TaxID=1191678 RepID=A0ABN7K376_9HYPH|nr:LysR family transcriptional regulator [Pseudorhizobium endolithicum]